VIGKPLLRLLPSCHVQPLGAPLPTANARANRSARSGCARQYESIASRGVGGMNGRFTARVSATGGKIAGRALQRRANDLRFRSAVSVCQLDMRLYLKSIVGLRRKTFVDDSMALFKKRVLYDQYVRRGGLETWQNDT